MTEVSPLGGGEATEQTNDLEEAAVEFACSSCGDEYLVTVESADEWRLMHFDSEARRDDVQAMIRWALGCRNPEQWITVDEDDEPTIVCPECVDRLKLEKARQTCPAWCTTDHAAEELPGGWWFRHEGPEFGRGVSAVAYSHEPAAVEVITEDITWTVPNTVRDRGTCAGELREMAAALSAAAEWLEAQQ